ncbi:MAG: hypothetical protein ACYS9X_07375 [Planctomycetota bacterium]|jgi:hypothetical protein
MRRELLDRYSSGKLVEERYLLRDISELAVADGLVAVSRLIVLPSFDPEFIITVLLGSIELEVESVRGGSQLWRALSIPEEEVYDLEGNSRPAFDPQNAVCERGAVQSAFAPHPFDSIERFAETAAAAPSIPFVRPGPDGITYATCDGVGYVHRFVSGGERLDAEWPNPSPGIDPAQCEIVDAYWKLLTCAGIKDGTSTDR